MTSSIECRTEGYGSAIVEPVIRLGMTDVAKPMGLLACRVKTSLRNAALICAAFSLLDIGLRTDRDFRCRCSRVGRTSRHEHCVDPLVTHRHQWR